MREQFLILHEGAPFKRNMIYSLFTFICMLIIYLICTQLQVDNKIWNDAISVAENFIFLSKNIVFELTEIIWLSWLLWIFSIIILCVLISSTIDKRIITVLILILFVIAVSKSNVAADIKIIPDTPYWENHN